MGRGAFFRTIVMVMYRFRSVFVGYRVIFMVKLRRMTGIVATAGPGLTCRHCGQQAKQQEQYAGTIFHKMRSKGKRLRVDLVGKGNEIQVQKGLQ